MSAPAPLSILIVEDHPDGAESLAELLSLCGHRVRVARTAAEATAACVAVPDGVLLDIGLPDRDGFDLAGALTALDPRPVLVALTGYPKLEGRSRALGIDHHLVKPVDPVRLAELLRACASSRRD